MGETAELVASIIMLAGTGSEAAVKLYDLAEELGLDTDSYRTMAAAKKVVLFSHSLSAISKSVEEDVDPKFQLQQVAKSVLDASKRILCDLKKILTALDPSGLTPDTKRHGWPEHFRTTFDTGIEWLLKACLAILESSSALLVASADAAKASRRGAPGKIT